MKYILSFLFSFLTIFNLQAQELNPVAWTFEQELVEDKLELRFVANIQDGWYLYAQEIAEDGPIPTSFIFNNIEVENTSLQESSEHLVEVYDEMFGMELKKYKEQVVFMTQIEVPKDQETIKGVVEFMCCNSTQCLPPKQIEFTFNLKP